MVRDSVCNYIKRMWDNPSFIAEVNHIDFFLIPKTTNLHYVHHYRLISLFNSIYKILSKIIVNRLKMCMDRFIPPNQIGFIPMRNIHENIVVAREILHSMHKLRGKKRLFAIKVDLEKAYDMIS